MSDDPGKHEKPDILPEKKSVLSLVKGTRFSSAFLTAVALAGIGYLADRTLQRYEQANLVAQQQQAKLNLVAQQQQDKINLYAQLIAQREQSANALRMDMFKNMIASFFKQRKVEENRIDMNDMEKEVYWSNFFSKRVLQLEMLAVNFGEAMSMSPLFKELESEIREAWYNNELDFVNGAQHIERLENLALKVSSWQLAALPQDNQKSYVLNWRPNESFASERSYDWPRDLKKKAEPAPDAIKGEDFDKEPIKVKFKSKTSSPGEQANDNASLTTDAKVGTQSQVGKGKGFPFPVVSKDDRKASHRDKNQALSFREVVFDGVTRYIAVEFSDPNTNLKRVTATVNIRMSKLPLTPAVPLTFKLDFYQFPMIDNIRLSNDHRLALVMKKFQNDPPHIEVALVIFPGMYGSQRDKPFLDVVMQQLPKIMDIPDFGQGGKL